MGLSEPTYVPIAGLERQRAANVWYDDWRRSLPTTLALVAFLAGCADLGQPKLSFRQPSLRVADAALAAGAPEVALRVADLRLAHEPRSLLALIAKGDALYAMGEREMARAAYRTAVAVDPTNVAAQLGLGRTLVQFDPSAAEAAFTAVIAQEPNNIAALSDLGIARDLQGHHAEAQDAYRRALVAAPETADVKVNLGLSLALSGSKDEAVRVLREAAADAGVVQDRRKELAGALVLAGDEAEARQVLSRAYSQPQPNSHPASGFADTAPLSAPHQALTNDALAEAASGSIAVKHKPSDGGAALHESPVMTTSAVAPPVAHAQPDLLQIPPTILTSPVVAVTRVSQGAPPDVARPVPLSASDVAPSVVDTAGQISIPTTVPQGPDVITASADASPAPTKPTVSTSANVPASEANRAVLEQSSRMPEGRAFVQLASLYSAQDASYEWRRLNRRMPDLLSGREPTITRADAHGQTYWCLRTFGFESLAEAKTMCLRMLGASGLRCWARAAS